MQIPKVIDNIKKYKHNTRDFKVPTSEYDRGLYNGLEIAQALIERRPSFLLNKDNTFDKIDVEAYPEFFL
tara:strand:- start:801 stop:1010 length:210 start_codon:yes stop_codon:yes gene_type:complete